MANVLTPFIPNMYQELDVVSRELVGFIPSVTRNSSAERAAIGQNILVPVSEANEMKDVTPSMTVPEPDDFQVGNVSITISKAKAVPFGLTGEEYRGLQNGMGVDAILGGNFAQALRVLTNAIELDIATEAAKHASRAYGTAGTTPFADNLKDVAQLRKILDDNGAPLTGRSLVLDTTSGAALRSLQQLTNVGDAGTTMTLRQGQLLELMNFSVKESAQIVAPEVGTGADATTDTTGYNVGATEITLAAAGTGTILEGDYITFAGDEHKYLVVKGASAVSGAKITIAKPGLRQAIGTSATAITVVGKSSRLIGFSSNAIQLVTRAPALPGGDDAAVDSMMLTDPRSGLTFEVRVYKGYRKVRMEVACAWGVKAIKDEHIAALLG